MDSVKDDATDGEGAEDEAIQTRRKLIRPRGANQTAYLKNIRTHDLAFGIGPAGTGKTYLAVAAVLLALDEDHAMEIIEGLLAEQGDWYLDIIQ